MARAPIQKEKMSYVPIVPKHPIVPKPMKTDVKISGPSASDGDIDLILRLNKLVPENDSDLVFCPWLRGDDPRVNEIERILRDEGWISRDEAREFGITDRRIYAKWISFDYDHDDIATADYATIYPMGAQRDKDIDMSRTASGQLEFRLKSPLSIAEIRVGSGYTIVMTTAIKNQIEAMSWNHMVIRRLVVPEAMRKKAAKSGRALLEWELNSDLELPRIAPGVKLTHFWHGVPYTGDRTRGCLIRPSERFPIPVPHYRACDLKRVGEFDMARTWEWFTNGKDEDKRLFVVSKRVYEFFRELDVENSISWEPVYVIEDE